MTAIILLIHFRDKLHLTVKTNPLNEKLKQHYFIFVYL